jgi:methionyl-tRNA formyltransferase
MRLAFLGTPEFAVVSLAAIVAAGFEVACVYSQPPAPRGRGKKLSPSPVQAFAEAHALPVRTPASMRDPEEIAAFAALELDAAMVVAFGQILPLAVIDAPRLGSFNLHASLLPRWRGAAPIQRAIMAGDTVTGIGVMRLSEGLDEGPTLAVERLRIGALDTAGTLHDRLAVLGGELVCLTIDELAAGRAIETPQPEDGVTYAEKISKAEALIDWREDAEQVLRKVRAFNPAPIAETRWNGEQLRIWQARASTGPAPSGTAPAAPGTVMAASPDGITVACGRGVLDIGRLQLAGRKSVTAAEFLRAHSLAGSRFA